MHQYPSVKVTVLDFQTVSSTAPIAFVMQDITKYRQYLASSVSRAGYAISMLLHWVDVQREALTMAFPALAEVDIMAMAYWVDLVANYVRPGHIFPNLSVFRVLTSVTLQQARSVRVRVNVISDTLHPQVAVVSSAQAGHTRTSQDPLLAVPAQRTVYLLQDPHRLKTVRATQDTLLQDFLPVWPAVLVPQESMVPVVPNRALIADFVTATPPAREVVQQGLVQAMGCSVLATWDTTGMACFARACLCHSLK